MNENSPNKVFFRLGIEDLFGYYSFIFGQPRETSAVALSYCRLFTISRNKLLRILRNH